MRKISLPLAGLCLVCAGLAIAFGLVSSSNASPARAAAAGPSESKVMAPHRARTAPVAPAVATAGTQQRTFVSVYGNDANTCDRLNPCRQITAALARTLSGGEVIVLDSGGYNKFTISQSVAVIAPAGVHAGVQSFTGDAITITGTVASDVVTLRGLTVTGLGGYDGIHFVGGGSLFVANVVVKNFAYNGIEFNSGVNGSKLFVDDSLVTGSGSAGMSINPTGATTATASIDHTRVEKNSYGIESDFATKTTIRDSQAVGQTYTGLGSFYGAETTIENSLTAHNNWGLATDSSGTERVSQSTITDNAAQGIYTGGVYISWGNNRLGGNFDDGSFTSTTPLQ
jgi:hypothetical protein